MRAIRAYQQFVVPLKDRLAGASGIVSEVWFSFFESIRSRLDPLGIEQHAEIKNNQTIPLSIGGLALNQQQAMFYLMEYIVQRVTIEDGASHKVASGMLVASYNPGIRKWEINDILGNYKNIAGTVLSLIPDKTLVSYEDTTKIWTSNGHGLVNGLEVRLINEGSGSTLPSGYNSTSKYYVANSTSNTFQLKSSIDGPIVSTTNNGAAKIFIIPFILSGQFVYTTDSITGEPFISKMTWRLRTMGAKDASVSKFSRYVR